MHGRLALGHSHQPADLDSALADFDRVPRLFPTAEAVPRARLLAAQTLTYQRKFDDAIAELGLVEAEYPTDPAAAGAYLAAGNVRVALGDPISALEELQQVRDRFPNSPEAPLALAHLALLNRLYVRAKAGPAYALSTETVGPQKLENIVGLVMTAKGSIYWAADSGQTLIGSATPNAEKPPAAVKRAGSRSTTPAGSSSSTPAC